MRLDRTGDLQPQLLAELPKTKSTGACELTGSSKSRLSIFYMPEIFVP
jgi:hypothetical protein